MKRYFIGLSVALIGVLITTLPLTLLILFDISFGISRFFLYIAGLPITVIGIEIIRDRQEENSESH